MATATLDRSLQQLNDLKNQFGLTYSRKIASLLKRIAHRQIEDAESLIRLHEILLFIRAYPHTPEIVKQAERLLRTFPLRIARLHASDSDLSALDHPEVSGIAGTSVMDTFAYQIVCWLEEHRPGQVDFYWEWFEDENRLAETWPRFMPLLEEDVFVEANVPYRDWLRNARGNRPELSWLLNWFRQLPLSETNKAELYNAQKLYVRWRFTYRDSRTGLRLLMQNVFYHDAPLIQRRDVRLKEELSRPAPVLQKLSTKEGQAAIDMARAASTVRYRELYGFTNGDPRTVCKTSLGRGVELLIIALPPEKRLPLRAYHSAMIYKNGVPVGYFEGLSLFERMESGFNLYYTFRDGETAWLYARILSVMRHLTGVASFSLDPYQVGFENEEGIESGAFWFYRKMGFRSTRRSIQKLTEGEESKIASRKYYRTPPATLRRLAEAPMILELDETRTGDWDRFQIRNVGFAVQRMMAKKFGGDVKRMRNTAVRYLAQILRVEPIQFSKTQQEVFEDFSLVLLLLTNLKSWSDKEKELLNSIIQAKGNSHEDRYLRMMQKHARLREAMIKLGNDEG
jgi:hypothetical protein